MCKSINITAEHAGVLFIVKQRLLYAQYQSFSTQVEPKYQHEQTKYVNKRSINMKYKTAEPRLPVIGRQR
jgi:hypothetical protein